MRTHFDGDESRFIAWEPLDLLILLGLIGVSAIWGIHAVDWRIQPFEDALMLLRYADHLAHGAGITWNIGDRPVEGATDFLYLVVVSFIIRLTRLGPIFASRLLLFASQLTSIALLYYGARRLFHANRVLAVSLSLYLAFGPGFTYVASGFSPPFYGLMALTAWYFACRTVVTGPAPRSTWAFAFAALLTALTRPDGLLLAIFMGAALLFMLGRRSLPMLVTVVAVFAIGGGAYFAWRLYYFGYMLPNPLYKKGGGHLYFDSLKFSASHVITLLLPFLPVLAVAFFSPQSRKRATFLLIPVVAFTSVWILLTNENNYAMRFQYVLLPIALLTMPYVLSGLPTDWRPRISASRPSFFVSLVIVTVLATVSLRYWKLVFPSNSSVDGSSMRDIGMQLAQWKQKNYTMVVTEAGTLPYYSKWRAIDAWGLNDSEIVHNPRGLTEEYLDQNHPAIIMYHTSFSNSPQDLRHIWTGDNIPITGPARFNVALSHYAVTHPYELAARWGPDPCNVHIWYVRRDLPETPQMLAIIRHSPHFFLDGAQVATNFMQPEPPAICSDPGEQLRPTE
jgi:arabinofuranosyltransferase